MNNSPFAQRLTMVLHPMIQNMIVIADALPSNDYDPIMMRLASMLSAVQLAIVIDEPIPSDILNGIATYCENIAKMIREIQVEKETELSRPILVPGSSDLN